MRSALLRHPLKESLNINDAPFPGFTNVVDVPAKQGGVTGEAAAAQQVKLQHVPSPPPSAEDKEQCGAVSLVG